MKFEKQGFHLVSAFFLLALKWLSCNQIFDTMISEIVQNDKSKFLRTFFGIIICPALVVSSPIFRNQFSMMPFTERFQNQCVGEIENQESQMHVTYRRCCLNSVGTTAPRVFQTSSTASVINTSANS